MAFALGIPAAVTAGLDAVGKLATALDPLINRFFPDPQKALEFRNEMMKTLVTSDVAQLEVNKAEAASGSLFVAGWRPFIGWICGIALGLVYIPKAIVLTIIWTYQAWTIVSVWHGIGVMQPLPAYPDLGVTDLIGLLASLLGMAALRSADKAKGVSS